jgi:hypothetical protein
LGRSRLRQTVESDAFRGCARQDFWQHKSATLHAYSRYFLEMIFHCEASYRTNFFSTRHRPQGADIGLTTSTAAPAGMVKLRTEQRDVSHPHP